jgi:hypothetical protein
VEASLLAALLEVEAGTEVVAPGMPVTEVAGQVTCTAAAGRRAFLSHSCTQFADVHATWVLTCLPETTVCDWLSNMTC